MGLCALKWLISLRLVLHARNVLGTLPLRQGSVILCPEHKKDNHKWTSDTLWKFSLAMNHLRWRCFVSLARALPSSPESMPVLKGAPTKSFSEWSLNHQASSKPGITSSHVDVQIFSPFVEVFSLALSQVVSIGYLYFELYWKEDYTRTFHFS